MTDSLLFNFISSYLSCPCFVLVYICYGEYKFEFYMAGAFFSEKSIYLSCR